MRLRHFVPLVVGLLLASLAGPGSALAGASHGKVASAGKGAHDGRIPGHPDFVRIGKKTIKFHPGKGEYEVREPGRPVATMHPDHLSESEAPGGLVALPTNELAPTCSTDGQRVVVVYTHRPADTTPTPTATIRSIVKRMNFKVHSESLVSSSGTRPLQLVVSCDSSSQIQVFDVATTNNYIETIDATLESVLGNPTGTNAVKYLVFDAADPPGLYSGIGWGYRDNPEKSIDNPNAIYTTPAVVYGGSYSYWATHTSLHELWHTFGATQFPSSGPRPPFASSHCYDGIDILCYSDGSGLYTETRCPASQGYEQPANVPLDCGYDTYFDSVSEPGEWLDHYWNTGGVENPFVREPTTTSGDSHPVSMRDPSTNQYWIYYRATDGFVWQLYRNPTTGNWSNTKVPATQPAAVGSSPVVRRNATNDAQWIYYRGGDGYVWELYRNPTTGNWANTKVPATQPVAAGSSPVILGDPSAGAVWIYYRGSDSYIWELYRNPTTGNWANTKVPATHSAAVGTSPVVHRNATTNAQWIYYRGSTGYVWELYRNPVSGNWSNTRIQNTQGVAPGSSPVMLVSPSGTPTWFYYRATDGFVWQLYRNTTTGSWSNTKIPAIQPAAVGTSPVASRNATNDAHWVYYEGADGYIWELYRNPTTGNWSNTKIPNAQAATLGSSPTLLGDPSAGEIWIDYRGSNGYVWELYRSPITGIWSNGIFPTAQM